MISSDLFEKAPSPADQHDDFVSDIDLVLQDSVQLSNDTDCPLLQTTESTLCGKAFYKQLLLSIFINELLCAFYAWNMQKYCAGGITIFPDIWEHGVIGHLIYILLEVSSAQKVNINFSVVETSSFWYHEIYLLIFCRDTNLFSNRIVPSFW